MRHAGTPFSPGSPAKRIRFGGRNIYLRVPSPRRAKHGASAFVVMPHAVHCNQWQNRPPPRRGKTDL